MPTSEDKPSLNTGIKEQLPADALANTKDQEVTPQEGTENDEHLPFELGQKLGYHRSAPLTLYQIVDYVFVVIAAVLTVRLAWILLKHGFQFSLVILVYLTFFWVLLAYLALPRLHQIMSSLYVPDYYIGRSKTGDGILGDPINLAWLGEEDDIHLALQAAGWTMADEITLSSSWKIIFASVLKRSYPAAPVSPLYLFGRKQDFAYQQEVDGNPSKRHHVRFWKVPEAGNCRGESRWIGWQRQLSIRRSAYRYLLCRSLTRLTKTSILNVTM
ncbi:LssY C-terminal domain-containing protein [Varibaculum cambriense]|nr:LssY C-terminal domain-containing protein [Varibaculum cambriense]